MSGALAEGKELKSNGLCVAVRGAAGLCVGAICATAADSFGQPFILHLEDAPLSPSRRQGGVPNLYRPCPALPTAMDSWAFCEIAPDHIRHCYPTPFN